MISPPFGTSAELDSTPSLTRHQVEQRTISLGEEGTTGGDLEGTPALDFPNLTVGDTPYTAADIDLLLTEAQDSSSRSFFGKAKPSPRGVEGTNATRVALLVRKYVSGELSDEQEARLKLASERVNRLLARVTEEDFRRLGDILERSDERLRLAQDIEKELGL